MQQPNKNIPRYHLTSQQQHEHPMYSSNQNPSRRQEHLAAAATLAYLGDLSPRNQVPALSSISIPVASPAPAPLLQSRNTFPMKLFEILQKNEHYDILRWVPSGKAFIILDKRRFAKEILSMYFKKAQYSSFARKLTRWQFVRLSKGPLAGAYYNKLFRRDLKSLCTLMACDGMVAVDLSAHTRQLNAPPSMDTKIQKEQCQQYIPAHLGVTAATSPEAPTRLSFPYPITNSPPSVLDTNSFMADFTRTRILRLQREQEWHRQQFIRNETHNAVLQRTQQRASNSHQDGMNDSQNANFIIAEAKKVLERSYIFYSRNRNQSHNSFNAQRSVLPRTAATSFRYRNKVHSNGIANRLLRNYLDLKCPQASAHESSIHKALTTDSFVSSFRS